MKDIIRNGEEYAAILIQEIADFELTAPEEDKLDSRLVEYWCEEIKTFADQTWQEYILGTRDSYKFDEEEMGNLYQKAHYKFVGDLLGDMVDKELIKAGVSEDGEIVYSLTENGKNYIERIK